MDKMQSTMSLFKDKVFRNIGKAPMFPELHVDKHQIFNSSFLIYKPSPPPQDHFSRAPAHTENIYTHTNSYYLFIPPNFFFLRGSYLEQKFSFFFTMLCELHIYFFFGKYFFFYLLLHNSSRQKGKKKLTINK